MRFLSAFVPALDLALGQRVHRGTADMGRLVGLNISGQFARDVVRPIVTEQPELVGDPD